MRPWCIGRLWQPQQQTTAPDACWATDSSHRPTAWWKSQMVRSLLSPRAIMPPRFSWTLRCSWNECPRSGAWNFGARPLRRAAKEPNVRRDLPPCAVECARPDPFGRACGDRSRYDAVPCDPLRYNADRAQSRAGRPGQERLARTSLSGIKTSGRTGQCSRLYWTNSLCRSRNS